MTDLYLGLIALGVLVMAGIQTAVVVSALKAARRLGEMAARFEHDVKPIVANLAKVSEEAARASTQAAAQVDRLDALVSSVAQRVDETAAVLQQSILQPARDGLALLSMLKGLLAGFFEPRRRQPDEPREGRPSRQERQPPPPERDAPDDDLFIG
jgi:hypothetical protein